MDDRENYWIKYSSEPITQEELNIFIEWHDFWHNVHNKKSNENKRGSAEILKEKNEIEKKFNIYCPTVEKYVESKNLEIKTTPIGSYVELKEPILLGESGGSGFTAWGGESIYYPGDILELFEDSYIKGTKKKKRG